MSVCAGGTEDAPCTRRRRYVVSAGGGWDEPHATASSCAEHLDETIAWVERETGMHAQLYVPRELRGNTVVEVARQLEARVRRMKGQR